MGELNRPVGGLALGDRRSAPPKYGQSDFRETSTWRLRGKLDVPKERFISYPCCESDENGDPIYGWSGWNHLQRATVLAELYQVKTPLVTYAKRRTFVIGAGRKVARVDEGSDAIDPSGAIRAVAGLISQRRQ